MHPTGSAASHDGRSTWGSHGSRPTCCPAARHREGARPTPRRLAGAVAGSIRHAHGQLSTNFGRRRPSRCTFLTVSRLQRPVVWPSQSYAVIPVIAVVSLLQQAPSGGPRDDWEAGHDNPVPEVSPRPVDGVFGVPGLLSGVDDPIAGHLAFARQETHQPRLGLGALGPDTPALFSCSITMSSTF